MEHESRITKSCTGAAIRSWKNGCVIRRGPVTIVGSRRCGVRETAAIILLLLLQNIGSGQLIRPKNERLPGEIELRAKVPAELEGKATVTFTEFGVIFDGGSYGASFRRENGRHLVIYFLHPGYWTKQAVKDKTQPIVVDLDADEETAHLEVQPDSPFEKRLLELLSDDAANKEHSHEQIKTLTRIRDCIRGRKPLGEIRKRFPDEFKDN